MRALAASASRVGVEIARTGDRAVHSPKLALRDRVPTPAKQDDVARIATGRLNGHLAGFKSVPRVPREPVQAWFDARPLRKDPLRLAWTEWATNSQR